VGEKFIESRFSALTPHEMCVQIFSQSVIGQLRSIV